MNAIKLNLLILLLLCLSACSDDENGDGGGALSLNKTSLTMKKGEDTQAVLISGGTVWEASVPQEDSWCSVMRMSDTKLVVMVEANEGADYRNTTVTVTSRGQNLTIAVEQIGEISYILDKPENILFNAAGDGLKLLFSANCDWEYTIDDDWCHITREADTLWIFADTTSLTEYRTTDVHFTLHGKENYLSFEAKQVPYIDPELNSDPEPYSRLMLTQGETVDIRISSKLPWTFTISPELPDYQVIDNEILRLKIPEDTQDYSMFFVDIFSGDMDYARTFYFMLMVGY